MLKTLRNKKRSLYNENILMEGLYHGNFKKSEILSDKIMYKYFKDDNGKFTVFATFPMRYDYYNKSYEERLIEECQIFGVRVKYSDHSWGSELGLFAKRDFQPGEIISAYYGYAVPYPYYTENDEEYTNLMFFDIYKEWNHSSYTLCIDNINYYMIPVSWCPAIYANQASPNEGQIDNAELYTHDNVYGRNPISKIFIEDLMTIRATEYIKEGDEIFINYGKVYDWDNVNNLTYSLPSVADMQMITDEFNFNLRRIEDDEIIDQPIENSYGEPQFFNKDDYEVLDIKENGNYNLDNDLVFDLT